MMALVVAVVDLAAVMAAADLVVVLVAVVAAGPGAVAHRVVVGHQGIGDAALPHFTS
jgi:hypothetical protein